jgi:chaperone required for assembly of F1-ATPase
MKMKALDQVSISSVKADTLRPGEEFEVSDALGTELEKKELAVRVDGATKKAPTPRNKKAPAPQNKAG